MSTARLARIDPGCGVAVVGMAADILQFTRFRLPDAVYPPHERVVRIGAGDGGLLRARIGK